MNKLFYNLYIYMEFNSINRVFEKVEKIGRHNCKMILAEKSPSSKFTLSSWQLRIFLYVPKHYKHNSEGDKIYYFKLKSEFEILLRDSSLSSVQLYNNLYNRETRNNMLDPTFNNVGYKNWIGPFSDFKEEQGKKECGVSIESGSISGSAPITILHFIDIYKQKKKLRDVCINGKSTIDSVTSLKDFIQGNMSTYGNLFSSGNKIKKSKGKKSKKKRRQHRRKSSKKSKKIRRQNSRKVSKKSEISDNKFKR